MCVCVCVCMCVCVCARVVRVCGACVCTVSVLKRYDPPPIPIFQQKTSLLCSSSRTVWPSFGRLPKHAPVGHAAPTDALLNYAVTRRSKLCVAQTSVLDNVWDNCPYIPECRATTACCRA